MTPRSYLFVPAERPERIAKAGLRGFGRRGIIGCGSAAHISRCAFAVGNYCEADRGVGVLMFAMCAEGTIRSDSRASAFGNNQLLE